MYASPTRRLEILLTPTPEGGKLWIIIIDLFQPLGFACVVGHQPDHLADH